MNIIERGPEIPDPTQLNLFDFGAHETEPVQHSTDSVESIRLNETMIRSPTEETEVFQLIVVRKFELNESQKELAGALHRKSRALCQSSIERHFEFIEPE